MGTFNTKTRANSDTYSTLGLHQQTTTENASESPQILALLASILDKTIHKNEKFLRRSRAKDEVTIFHGSRAPGLSIKQYIERIYKYSKCSPSCFVVAYIYMDSFLQRTSSCLTSLNVHRVLLACVLLATKFLDDACCNNAYYAKIGGVSIAELNKLERELLLSLDFRLHVTLETFDQYCLQLQPNCQIERTIQVCGLKGSWPNKDEPKCSTKFASRYTCSAI